MGLQSFKEPNAKIPWENPVKSSTYWELVATSKKNSVYCILKAGEELELQGWETHTICRELKKDFHEISTRTIIRSCPDKWKDASQIEVNETNAEWVEKLAHDDDYIILTNIRDTIRNTSNIVRNTVNWFTHPKIAMDHRVETWQRIKNEYTFFQDLKKVNNEIELLISQMREEVDMRISLMQVNKMLVLVLTITKSIRNISGIVGESTKWITKIAKKMAGLGPVRCPVCYTDIRNIVTEINEDQDQKNNYMRECLDRNKKEGLITTEQYNEEKEDLDSMTSVMDQ